MNEKMLNYLNLLNQSYDDVIVILLNKYGNVCDDFLEKNRIVNF